jgi:hypothetical protein
MNMFEAFFESYRSDWQETRDGNRIAEFYHAPCLTLRADGSFASLQTKDEVVRFFQTVADTLYKQGIEQWASKDLTTETLGSRSAIVTMTWLALNSEGSLLRQWRQSYNLVRFGQDWKIVLSTFHLEK